MRIFFIGLVVLLNSAAVTLVYAAEPTFDLRLSAGNSLQARNDVQIPNNASGTRFSLANTVGEGPVRALRFELNWQFRQRHGIRIMLAPLSYTETTVFRDTVRFEGAAFRPEEALDASYRFNSWRLGYHYLLISNDRFNLQAGGTLKVRDAEIRLEQGDTVRFNDDLGFVPLLYLSARYQLGKSVSFRADLDGLAGGPGRAIDAGVALDYSLSKRWRLGVEARVLDGGADIDELFNFAQFRSASIALSTGF